MGKGMRDLTENGNFNSKDFLFEDDPGRRLLLARICWTNLQRVQQSELAS
jgi:hypothetical protein